MDKDIIEMIYKAFLGDGLLYCYFCDSMYEISFVEDRRMKTDLFIRMLNNKVDVSVAQSAPRYPVYDSKGNVVYFGI